MSRLSKHFHGGDLSFEYSLLDAAQRSMNTFWRPRSFSLFVKSKYYLSVERSEYIHRRPHSLTDNTPAYPRCARIRSFATVMDTKVRRIADDLEKPDLDDRSYRVIELPNKLEALLAHDPQTDKASASLSVNVGNFSDDDDMPGMAHAVEHLLFMGTEKVRDS